MQNNLFTKSSFRNVILVLLFLALFADCSYGQLQTARMTPQGVGYLEYLPPDYSTNTGRTYPVLIFLHGAGERGNGTATDLEKVKANGPPKLIKNGSTMCFNVNGTSECFIVISPQLGTDIGGWWPSVLQPFFNEILNGSRNYRIDKSRVYLTGLSMGGQGVYIGLGETTDVFAAAAVVAGFDNGNGCTISLRKTPVWGFHGTSDTTIPYATGLAEFNDIINCTTPVPTAELKWTSYPNVGHNSWDNAYTTDHSIQSPLNVYEWLLSKRKTSFYNALPVVSAGTNKTLVLPTNSTPLTGSATDADGTIVSYQWTQVSGPSTATLANANSATVTLSNLVAGVYTLKLTATDNSGGTGTATVTVTESAVAAAGTNLALLKNVTTSSNEAWLGAQGIGANAVDGNLTTRWSSEAADPQWIQVDLGTSYIINRVQITWEAALASNYEVQYSSNGTNWSTLKAVTGNTTLVNNHTGLSGTGRYIRIYGTKRYTTYGYSIYELEVYGAAAGTNIAPVANAGADKKILSPASTLTISGTATDSDGTIASTAWTKVSGPSAVLSNANTLSLSLSSLISGTYVFRLTATDNAGATSSDDVSVMVNNAPVVNAGADKNIQLPASTVIINGTASDSDGTISAYSWSKVSGPAVTLTNATTANLSLSSLVAGTYVFRLTATDNAGDSGTDDVNVIVKTANAAPIINAGSDVNLTLPTNSITLTATAADTDGTIASYAWTEVSGPSVITLTSTTSSTLPVTSLISGSYVFRVTATDNLSATAYDEVTVRVIATTAALNNNIALGKPVTVSSTEAWRGAQSAGVNAVDGNLSTRWASSYTDTEWIAIDLGDSYSITRIKITWETALAANYRIDYSSNGSTWNTIKSVTGNTSLSNDYKDVIGSARYVRIYATLRGTVNGYSIYEIEVYGDLQSAARTVSTEASLTTSSVTESDALPASEVEEKASLIFLDKTYAGGKQYDVAIFNASGNLIYTGKWSSEIHTEVLKPNGFYFYHIIEDGKRIDSGRVVTTDQ